jgi:uncharacterized protein YtpQ (UPF0354 family)
MRRTGFLLLMGWAAALLPALCAAQDVPADEEGFAKLAAERIRQELPAYDIQPVSRLTLEGKRADGASTGQMNLDRVFGFCARNPANCLAALDHYAKGVAEVVKERDRPIEKAMVRIAVRPMAYVDKIRQQAGTGVAPLFARPLAGGLAAVPVLDFARTVRFVSAPDVAKLGVSEEELFALGEQNLRSTTRPLAEVTPVPTGQSLGQIAGEDYASSRLLFHADWRELSGKLNHKLVVMVPVPDVLLYGEASTPMGVEALRSLANHLAGKASRPLSPVMFLWTEGGWEVLK